MPIMFTFKGEESQVLVVSDGPAWILGIFDGTLENMGPVRSAVLNDVNKLWNNMHTNGARVNLYAPTLELFDGDQCGKRRWVPMPWLIPPRRSHHCR